MEARRTKKYLEKMGASGLESVMVGQQILMDLINVVIPYEEEEIVQTPPVSCEMLWVFFLSYVVFHSNLGQFCSKFFDRF